MSEFVFYEEQWNIRQGEIHQGGASTAISSSHDSERTRG